MFLLRDKLITQGEKRETSTKTCNETMLRAKLRVLYIVFRRLNLRQTLETNYEAANARKIFNQRRETEFTGKHNEKILTKFHPISALNVILLTIFLIFHIFLPEALQPGGTWDCYRSSPFPY